MEAIDKGQALSTVQINLLKECGIKLKAVSYTRVSSIAKVAKELTTFTITSLQEAHSEDYARVTGKRPSATRQSERYACQNSVQIMISFGLVKVNNGLYTLI